jgi:hypothetical protein
MLVNIILTVCFLSVWFILYFLMLSNLKPRNNIIIGVTLPVSAHDDPQVKIICASFKKRINLLMLPLLLIMLPPFFLEYTGLLMILLMSWLFAVIVIPFVVFARHREMLMALKRSKNWNTGGDDDDYWLFGLFYYNPTDSRLLVNSRAGMNMTVNLAKKAGKIIMSLSVLAVLSMPFLGIWLWKEEITPPRLILNKTELISVHTREQYVIQLDMIESMELIDTLPSMIRVGGTSMNNLLKGNFRSEEYGASRVCLRPLAPPFLVIKSEGKTYILNDSDSDETIWVYTYLNFGNLY